MNILIIGEVVYPHIGGIENVSWNLANEFTRLGHKVFAVFKECTYDGVQLEPIQGSLRQHYLPNTENCYCVENIEWLISFLRVNEIDIILNQYPNLLDISRLVAKVRQRVKERNIKLVFTFHTDPLHLIKDVKDSIMYTNQNALLFMRERLGYNPIKWVKSLALMLLYKVYRFEKIKEQESKTARVVYNYSDAFILLSDKFIEPFTALMKENSCNKLYSITNPVSLSNKNIEIRDKEKVIVFVGRLVRSQKRVDRLLMIWKKLYKQHQDWTLVIVGDGTHRKYLEEMSIRHKLERIEFKGGQVPADYYKKASIFTLVSTCEGFGLVLVEAQQAGCIPMAFDSFESVTDIITDGEDGFLVTPFDLEEYAEKLSQLMRDDELRNSIANNCLTKDYSKFNGENVALQWIELFENIQLK